MVYCLYTFVWRQAYFPETSASEPKGEQAEQKLKIYWSLSFMTLNSNHKASLAWFHFGAPLAAQLFSVNAEGHISCVLGNVDALRSTLTAASNVVITL